MKKVLALGVALALLFTVFAAPATNAQGVDPGGTGSGTPISGGVELQGAKRIVPIRNPNPPATVDYTFGRALLSKGGGSAPYEGIDTSSSEPVRIVVQLEGDPLYVAEKRMAAQGEVFAAAEYIAQLEQSQTQVLDTIRGLGIKVQGKARMMRELFNGFVITVPANQVPAIAKIKGVKAIYPDREVKALVELGGEGGTVAYIGATKLHEAGITGQGVTVGILDTGIDYNHPDLKDAYAGGFDVVDWDDDPMETVGEGATTHGTHVAGIVHAVAPGARIRMYRVLGPGGSGTEEQVYWGLVKAYEDGCKVLNLSLGSGVNVYDWLSWVLDRLAELGVTAAVANGNDGPAPWSVGSPATARNVISVGAMGLPEAHPTVTYQVYGAPATTVVGNYMTFSPHVDTVSGAVYYVVTAGRGHPEEFPADAAGRVALVERGDMPFRQIALNAQAAGCAAVLIYNNVPGDFQGTLVSPKDITIPVISLSRSEGEQLIKNVVTNDLPVTFGEQQQPPYVAEFSSRGPATAGSEELPEAIKPDVSAPGVSVDSCIPGGGHAEYSGTSMAAPHVAGACALLLQAHPDWGPADFKAALMNTADSLAGYGPLDQGSGVIRVDEAAGADLLVLPGAVSFGRDDAATGTSVLTATLTIRNRGTSAQSVQLVASDVPDGMSVSFTPTSVTLGAGGTKEVQVVLSVNHDSLKGFRGVKTGTILVGSTRVPFMVVLDPAPIDRFYVSPAYFSPNRDGSRDWVEIGWSQNVEGQIWMRAWAVDPDGELTTSWVLLPGLWLLPGSWFFRWDGTDWWGQALPDGYYVLQIEIDGYSTPTEGDQAPVVLIDTQPPNVIHNVPGWGAVTNRQELTIEGYVYDTMLDPSIPVAGDRVILTCSLNGGEPVRQPIAEEGPFEFTLPKLQDNENSLEFQARDAAGNVLRLNRTIFYDATTPPLDVRQPADYETVVVGSAGVTLRVGGVTDPHASVTVSYDGSSTRVPLDVYGSFAVDVPLAAVQTDISVTAASGSNVSAVARRVFRLSSPGRGLVRFSALGPEGPLTLDEVVAPWWVYTPSLGKAIPASGVYEVEPGYWPLVGIKRSGDAGNYFLFRTAEVKPGVLNDVVFDGRSSSAASVTVHVYDTSGAALAGETRALLPLSFDGDGMLEMLEVVQAKSSGHYQTWVSPGQYAWFYEVPAGAGDVQYLFADQLALGAGKAVTRTWSAADTGTVAVSVYDGHNADVVVQRSETNEPVVHICINRQCEDQWVWYPRATTRVGAHKLGLLPGRYAAEWWMYRLADYQDNPVTGVFCETHRQISVPEPGAASELRLGGPISGFIWAVPPDWLPRTSLPAEKAEEIRQAAARFGASDLLKRLDLSNRADPGVVRALEAQPLQAGGKAYIVPGLITAAGEVVWDVWGWWQNQAVGLQITVKGRDQSGTEQQILSRPVWPWELVEVDIPEWAVGSLTATVTANLGSYQDPLEFSAAIPVAAAPVKLSLSPRGISEPGVEAVTVGENGLLAVDVVADRVYGLYGYELHLAYTPGALEVIDSNQDAEGIQIEPGDVFAGKSVLMELNSVDPARGTIDYAISLQGADPGVVSDHPVKLATVYFRAKQSAGTETAVWVVGIKLAGAPQGQPPDTAAMLWEPEVAKLGVDVTPSADLAGTVLTRGRFFDGKPDNSGVRVHVTALLDGLPGQEPGWPRPPVPQYTVVSLADGSYHVVGLPIGFKYRVLAYLPDDLYPAYFADEATVKLDAVGRVEMRQLELVGGDTKRDGLIDIFDIVLIGAAYNAKQGEVRYDARADINRDGVVDLQDLTVAAFYFNRAGSHAPSPK